MSKSSYLFFFNNYKKKRKRLDKRSNKIYFSWHFSTKSYPILTEIYNLFYKNRKKVIPVNIIDLIAPASLAMWIMSDGWKNSVTLATNAFNEAENLLLIEALNGKFALDCRLIKDHNYPSIHIPYNQIAKLQTVVLPHMHKSFLYKLYL